MLWNSKEAFLFVSTEHRGYKFSKLAYIAEIVKEYFNIVPSPSNESYTTLAFKIATDATYRYPSQAIQLVHFRSADHLIYASHGREVWKLGEAGFAVASQEEQQRSTDTGPRDFKDLNGWFRHTMGDSPYEGLELLFGEKLARLRVVREGGFLCINIEYSGGKSEKLLTIEERIRKVGRAEYELLFPK